MAANIVTAPGKFETRTFIANVRRPTLPTPPANAPGGTMVHMFLAGEDQAICWDDRLTIEFNGSKPCVCAVEIASADDVPTLFTAGDSTVGDPRRGPGGNWPTQMCQFFKPDDRGLQQRRRRRNLQEFCHRPAHGQGPEPDEKGRLFPRPVRT